jgi:hypothetical protein
MAMSSATEIAHIARLLATGMSPVEIAEHLNDAELEALQAADEDDSDEGIERRCGIHADDTVDYRGQKLLPMYSDDREPLWM